MAVSTIDALYNGGSEKVTATSTGIDVTGTVTADGLTVDGNATISSAAGSLYLEDNNYTAGQKVFGVTSKSGDLFLRSFTDDKLTATNRFGIDHSTGDISFYEDTGTTPKFFWDASAESLGIGTISPSHKIDVSGTGQITGGNSAGIDTRFTVASSGNGGSGRGVGLVLAPGGSGNSVEAVRLVGLQQTSAATANNASFVVQVANTSGTLTERMRLTSGGYLAVGNTLLPTSGTAGVSLAPEGNVHCGVATTANTNVMRFDNPNGRVGSISTTNSSTSYNTSSDYRLKTDAQPMTGASARVQALNPVNFEWIADGTRVDGFLAHEAQDIVPEAVSGAKDAMRDEEYEVTPAVLDDDGNVVTEAVMGTRSVPDYQGIDQSKLVPLLTAALQEALTEIAALKARVTTLEG